MHDKRDPGLFKEEFINTEMLCLCGKFYCCYDVTTNKFEISSKSLNKHLHKQSSDGLFEKYRRLLDQNIKTTSTNRGFRANSHIVTTYEQIEKSISKIYAKEF